MANQERSLKTRAYNHAVGVVIALAVVAAAVLWILPGTLLRENLASVCVVGVLLVIGLVVYGINGYHYTRIDEAGIHRCSPFGTTVTPWDQIRQIAIVPCGEEQRKGVMFSKNVTDYPLTWELTTQRYASNYWLTWFYLTREETDYDSFNEEALRTFLDEQGIDYTDYTE